MTAFAALLVALGRALTPRAWLTLGLVAFALLLLVCAYQAGRADQHEAETAKAAQDAAQAQRLAERDLGLAARERTTDAATVQDHHKDLTHAVAPIPDARPSDRRRALNCARMRREGQDVRALPACSGSDGPA